MDAQDRKALALLLKDGRITWSDLGHALGMSAPAVADRVRKLEEQGVIRGFTALLDADAAQHLHRVRHHLDAGADARKAARLLVDLNVEADLPQRGGGREVVQ